MRAWLRSVHRPLPAVALAVVLWPATAPAGIPACPGDCNGDGGVLINELLIGVNVALGSQPISACPAMDANGSGSVLIDDLIRAVAAALEGCPPQSTPTAQLTATTTSTASIPDATSTETAPIADTPTPSPKDTASATVPPSATSAPESPTITPTETPVPPPRFCDLPGSYQMTGPGMSVVPGGSVNGPNLSFVHLPIGFCAHFFTSIGNPRQLRFAPTGELFVASPTKFTTSNGINGQAAIMVLADDDGDGFADYHGKFLQDGQQQDIELREVVGLLFANDHLYFQNATHIMRVPYTAGDRTTSQPSEEVANITIATDTLHWTKSMDIADDGTIYVGNGSTESEGTETTPRYAACADVQNRAFRGGVVKLDGSPGGTPVVKGFRNPIAIRCARGHNRCFAIELAKDYSYGQGGREKILQIHEGDDWGFPCCATRDTPYAYINPPPDCSHVAQETASFYISDTPFDLDFEKGKWPEPWKDRAFVPLHGAAGSWRGARLVAIEPDDMTGQLLPGTDLLPGSPLPGPSSGAMSDFATGWDAGTGSPGAHGRPTVVAFAADGRLFLGNDTPAIGDTQGSIIWIAPLDLEIPR